MGTPYIVRSSALPRKSTAGGFSFANVSTGYDGTTASSRSFSMSFGDEAGDRYLILSVILRSSGTTANGVISPTIGGIAAQPIGSTYNNAGAGNDIHSSMFIANVTKGTTGLVDFTQTGSALRAFVTLYRMVGGNPVPTSTFGEAADSISFSETSPVPLTVPTGGAACYSIYGGGTSETISWGGTATEDYNATQGTFVRLSCAHTLTAGASGMTMTTNVVGTWASVGAAFSRLG